LLVLFVVVAGGYLLGQVRVCGFSLGVAAVLFAGIGVGALDERLSLPDIVYLLGLAIFVYTMGLAAGPGFAASLRRTGLRWNVLTVVTIVATAGVIVAVASVMNLGGPRTAGFFAGVLTNTPALAAVVEKLADGPDANLPIVAYSLAYPASVVASMIAISVLRCRWHIDAETDAVAAGTAAQQIISQTAEVERPVSVTEVVRAAGGHALIGRVRHDDEVAVADPDLNLHPGDRLTLVGTPDAVLEATRLLGHPSEERLDADRVHLDFRRVFVSNPALVGARVRDLDLARRFGAVVTRVRRGDVDMLADGATVLELGDRARVVAPPSRMDEISRYFGDSYEKLGRVDLASLAAGLGVGLLLGTTTVPLPGVGEFSLGSAGGPLVVGLVLGARRRTGPFVWQLPAGVNLSLRQVGLALFLAGVGTRAGHSFAATITTGGGWELVATSFCVCVAMAFTVLTVGHKLLRIPFGVMTGVLGGLCTQPATLAFASDQARNPTPELGYAAVFPVAMILKICIAQVLLSAL
jgi:putative transport protein